MGLGVRDTVAPSVKRKITYLASRGMSFAAAADAVSELLEIDFQTKRVERLAEREGGCRVAEREASVAAWAAKTLVEKEQAPPGVKPPAVACVSCDGGRLQRCDLPEEAKSRWAETKVGILLELKPQTHASDPCPQIPTKFLDLAEMEKVTREIKRAVPKGQVFTKGGVPPTNDAAGQNNPEESKANQPGTDPGADECTICETFLANPLPELATAPAAEDPVAAAKVVAVPPEVVGRDVVASLAGSHAFGKHLAAQAWELGFAAAPAKAFVADGSSTNWGIWEREFKHQKYVPILDFIHALTYVFSAAMAGRPRDEGAPAYRRWITWLWEGRVLNVIVELAERARELGSPSADAGETDPCRIVAETLTYLTNQQSRMNYPSYRQAGLPVTSSHIESAVKQISRRVKGSEKFWTEAGAEALLQLRADLLSDTRPLDGYWRRQMENATGTQPYSPRAAQPKQTKEASA